MTTSVLIADDHPLMRSAVAALLDGSDFRVVASAEDAASALSSIRQEDPDIAIVDLAMPGGSGLEILRALRLEGDQRPVVVLTAAIDDHRLAAALALSVNGIVMKNSRPTHLLECLQAVRIGRSWIDPELRNRAEAAKDRDGRAGLAPREHEIAALVARGLRNRDIAAELGITEGTVKVYLHSIFEKLGVASRMELAIRVGQSEAGDT